MNTFVIDDHNLCRITNNYRYTYIIVASETNQYNKADKLLDKKFRINLH